MSLVGFKCSGDVPFTRFPGSPAPFFCEKCPDISMPRETEALPRKKCQSKALARGFSDETAMELSPQDIHGQLTAQF